MKIITILLMGLLSMPFHLSSQSKEKVVLLPATAEDPDISEFCCIEPLKFHLLTMHEVGIRAHYYRPDFPPLSNNFIVYQNFHRIWEVDGYYQRSLGRGYFLRGAAGLHAYGFVGNRYKKYYYSTDNHVGEESGLIKTGYLRIAAGRRFRITKFMFIDAGLEARTSAGLPSRYKGTFFTFDNSGNVMDFYYSTVKLSGGWSLGGYAFTRVNFKFLKHFTAGTEFAIGVQMDRGTEKRDISFINASGVYQHVRSEEPVSRNWACFEMLPRLNLGYAFFTTREKKFPERQITE